MHEPSICENCTIELNWPGTTSTQHKQYNTELITTQSNQKNITTTVTPIHQSETDKPENDIHNSNFLLKHQAHDLYERR
jgi:hypothetical protein